MMSKRRRTKRRHKHTQSQKEWLTPFSAILASLVCLWTTIPYGSANLFSRAVACVAISVAVWIIYLLLHRSNDIEYESPKWLSRVLLLVAAGWIALQTVPLPRDLVFFVHPRAKDFYKTIYPAHGGISLSFNVFATNNRLMLWIAYALLGWISWRFLSSSKAARAFGFGLVIIGVIQSLYAITESASATLPHPQFFQSSRLIGTFSSPNSFGGLMAITIPVTLGLILSLAPRLMKNSRERFFRELLGSKHAMNRLIVLVLCVIGFCAQCVALLLSASRGAIVSTTICVAALFFWFLILFKKRLSRGSLFVFVIIVLIITGIGIGGSYTLAIARFKEIATADTLPDVPRIKIWKGAIDMFLCHPLGVGAGCFENAFCRFQPTGFGAHRVYHAHNDYLEMLCEIGIPGFAALVALLCIGFMKCGKLIRPHEASYSVWIFRGALMGALAALMHAFVDFNLTSRPGITTSFIVLSGIILGYQRPSRIRKRKPHGKRVMAIPGPVPEIGKKPPPTLLSQPASQKITQRRDSSSDNTKQSDLPVWKHRHFQKKVSLILLTIMCSFTAIYSARTAISTRITERGRIAAGATPDPYFRFPPKPANKTKSLQLLKKAVALTPDRAWAHYVLGKGRTAKFQKQLEEQLEKQLKVAAYSRHEQIRALLFRAFAINRYETYKKAILDYERALQLLPSSPDISAALCRAMAETCARITDRAEVAEAAQSVMNQAQQTVLRAPNDTSTLTSVCHSLAICHEFAGEGPWTPELRSLLRKWGHKALSLQGGGGDRRIVEYWSRAGISFLDIMSSVDLPVRSLWHAYKRSAREFKARECLLILKAIINNCSQKDPADYPSTLAPEEKEKYLRLATKEKCRWMLRLGRFDMYQLHKEDRRWLFRRYLEQKLSAFDKPARSIPAYRLKLQRMQNTTGLSSGTRLELAALLLAKGSTDEAGRIINEECCRISNKNEKQLTSFAEIHLEQMEDSFCRSLLEARYLMIQKKFYSAYSILTSLTGNPETPFRLRPRVRLLAALCSIENDRPDKAASHLKAALDRRSRDRAVLETMRDNRLFSDHTYTPERIETLLSSVSPQFNLDTHYLGGRIVINGFSITRATESLRGSAILKLYCAFLGAVPPELSALITTWNPNEATSFITKYSFSAQNKLSFAKGEPVIGATMVAEIPLPPQSRLGKHLRISLRDQASSEYILSEEQFRHIEIFNWQDYINKNTVIPQTTDGSSAQREIGMHE